VIKKLAGENTRLVILIDDLDRCQPEAAYKLLEGIKIYLNLPNCIFVLAMDQRQLERAVAQCLPGHSNGAPYTAAALQQGREYLEKIFQDVWHLPLIPFDKHCEFMSKCLAGQCSPEDQPTIDGVLLILKEKSYLPANARKLKAYANTLRRFVEHCHAPQDWPPEKHQKMLIICSCMYHFHPEIYRRLEASPGFYNEVREWASGGRSANPVFNYIEIAGLGPSGTDAPPGSGGGAFVNFPEPATGNVFRIRELVYQVGAVTETEARKYLLPYARP
jgi:hypothetical protein